MTDKIVVATTQMDVRPAPREERLARAARLVMGAVQGGAKLVVLPELFNTGYSYSDDNFGRAETLFDPTVIWMRETAAQYQIHLAGTLLLREKGDIYNALFLFAPDGRFWRYDKNYPWGWERAYFRPGRSVALADTALGKIGLMTCWDVAHRRLWREYQSRVDLLVVCSSPPDATNPVYIFPSGNVVSADQMGWAMAAIRDDGLNTFDKMVSQQSAWLQTPLVMSTACGSFESGVPNGLASLACILPSAAWLYRFLSQAGQMQMKCSMLPAAKIVARDGKTLAHLDQSQGESFVITEIELRKPAAIPNQAQPRAVVSPAAYFLADFLLPWFTKPVYKHGIRGLEKTERKSD